MRLASSSVGNTADFLLWLSLERMSARYARHFDLLAQESAVAIN